MMIEIICIVAVVLMFCYIVYDRRHRGKAEAATHVAGVNGGGDGANGVSDAAGDDGANGVSDGTGGDAAGGDGADGVSDAADVPNFYVKELCVELLRSLNCNVEFAEDDKNVFYFEYQGERFSLESQEDSLMVNIVDPWWGIVDLDDLEEVSRVRKVINIINLNYALKMVYTIDKAGHRLGVHTMRQCMMIPQIPNIEDYMRCMLNGFFEVQRDFKSEMDKLRREEYSSRA